MIEKRSLTTFSLTLLGINATVGSGIFILPGLLAQTMGSYSVLAFLLCGLLLTSVAFTFSSLSKLTSRNGGPYLYAALAFPPKIAFLVGWMTWLCACVSCGAVGSAIGEYFSYFFPHFQSPVLSRFLAGSFILLFGFLNYRGLSYGNRAMMVLTVLKMLPLLALSVTGIYLYAKNPIHVSPKYFDVGSLSQCFLFTLFACQGFEAVPILAGETRYPEKTIPRSIFYSLWFSLILYCILQIGLLTGPAVGSAKPLADHAQFLWGNTGGAIVALTGLISVIGFVAGIALAAPRFLIPMCEDGLLPKTIAKKHAKHQTPAIAVLLTTFVSFAVTTQESFKSLIELSCLSVALQYFFSSLALLKISLQLKTRHKYVAMGSLVISVIFAFQASTHVLLTFAAASIVGILIHTVYSWTQRKSSPKPLLQPFSLP